MAKARVALSVALLFVASSLLATTFIVPSDDALFAKSDAVVVVTVTGSQSGYDDRGRLVTWTDSVIEEVIKGSLYAGDTLTTIAPGGAVGASRFEIPGAPRFRAGSRALLFVFEESPGVWGVVDMTVGKFEFAEDVRGRGVLVRAEGELAGWDETLQPFKESRREAGRFLAHLRKLAAGEAVSADYAIEAAPLKSATQTGGSEALVVADAIVPPASNYLMAQGGNNMRWNQFPGTPAVFRNFNGAAVNGSTTALTNAAAAWTNDAGSVVVINTGTSLLGNPVGQNGGSGATADGENSVRWEVDLTGINDFTCTILGGGGFSYSGVLGIGGPINIVGSHTFDGSSYFTITEGDVDMNRGIASANCNTVLPQWIKDAALAHEIGHALNFRHSDLTRDNGAACASPLPCELTSALMRSSLPNTLGAAALQSWDVDAVRAVYPGAIAVVGDVDGSGTVDATDLSTMITAFRANPGGAGSGATDCDGNGTINGRDILCVENVLRPLAGTQTSVRDIDRDGTLGGLTDGLLALRRFFGFSGSTLVTGAVAPTGANRTTSGAIEAYFTNMGLAFDVDGNGAVDPLTDGLLILRYSFGFTGSTLINGAIGGGATRTTAVAIEAYLAAL